MKERATAIAIATIMVAAGLSVAPPAAALTEDCNEDFEIADSEQQASKRKLPDGERINGIENVSASDGDQTLTVRLETSDDVLAWHVFEETLTGCQEYDEGGCNGENTISSKGAEQSCTLNAPSVGTRTYVVGYMEDDTDTDSLKFSTFLE